MIKGKNVSFYILFFMFGFLFFHRFIIQTFGISDGIKYLLDLLNVLLFICALFKQRISNTVFLFFYLFCLIVLIATGMISFLMFGKIWNTSLVNVIFDLRNIIRFPIFFISCYSLLDMKQTEKIFSFIIGFHLCNCFYIVYQYFTLEVAKYWMRGDNLNGFFGTETGGNQFVNVIMIITTMVVIDKYIKKEYSKNFTFFYVGINLAIAILIELKFYFVEFAIIFLYFVAPYLKKPTKKQFLIGGIVLVALPFVYAIMVHILYSIYPWMEGSMSIKGMITMNSSDDGYTGKGDFNRLNTISSTITKIFDGDLTRSLIGIGYGTANLNGEFAKEYEWTHYSWMSTSYMFIETGFIGLICYTISLMLPFFLCRKNSVYMHMSKLGAIFLVALMIYDEALRTEAGYMAFFIVSTGMIAKNDCTEEYYKCQRLIIRK